MIVEHNQSTTYSGGQYENAYKFNGKELDGATGMYYYGARYYDPRISIFVSVDPAAEMYRGIGGYVYVANNPINFIDPTGMHIEPGSESEKEANNIKNNVTQKITDLTSERSKLEKDKKDVTEITARIGELTTTLDDIQKMFDDPKNEYKYSIIGEGEAPGAIFTGQNSNGMDIITMHVEGTMESKIHESRHGGQHARGELNIVTSSGYGVKDEISAYRAEYSWDKKLEYRVLPSAESIKNMLGAGQKASGKSKVHNINQIHRLFIKELVDPGFKTIYPPSTIPLDVWNTN